MGDQIEPEAKWIEGRDRAGYEIRQAWWRDRDRADEGRGRAAEANGCDKSNEIATVNS
jgi:hypothetical protein